MKAGFSIELILYIARIFGDEFSRRIVGAELSNAELSAPNCPRRIVLRRIVREPQYPSTQYPSIQYPSIQYPFIQYPSIQYIHPYNIHPYNIHPYNIHPYNIHPYNIHPYNIHPYNISIHTISIHTISISWSLDSTDTANFREITNVSFICKAIGTAIGTRSCLLTSYLETSPTCSLQSSPGFEKVTHQRGPTCTTFPWISY